MVESLLFEVTPVAIGSRRNPIFASFSDRGKLKQHSQAWSVLRHRLRRQSLLLRFHINPIFCGRTGGQQDKVSLQSTRSARRDGDIERGRPCAQVTSMAATASRGLIAVG